AAPQAAVYQAAPAPFAPAVDARSAAGQPAAADRAAAYAPAPGYAAAAHPAAAHHLGARAGQPGPGRDGLGAGPDDVVAAAPPAGPGNGRRTGRRGGPRRGLSPTETQEGEEVSLLAFAFSPDDPVATASRAAPPPGSSGALSASGAAGPSNRGASRSK